LNDAAIAAISDENRFDAAYKCVMQCAMASLLPPQTMVVLDGLRKQRNIADYDGDPISLQRWLNALPKPRGSFAMYGHGLLSIIQRSVNGTTPPQSREPRGRRLHP